MSSLLRHALVAVLAALFLAGPVRAEEPGTIVVHDRFERPRPIPTVPAYQALTAELLSRVEAGGRWHVILNGPGSAASAEVADGAAVLRLLATGAQWYAVQFAYLPVKLRPSREYRVTVRARADRPVRTTFDLCAVEKDWYSFSGKTQLLLTAEWQELEVRFRTRSSEEDPAARLELNFGNVEPNVIRVAEVRVVETAIASKPR
jgi:hypothetical protein